MNIGEANSLNALLRYLLNLENGSGGTTSHDAMLAAARLADKANKALMAGLGGDDVRRLWHASAPAPAKCPRRPPR